jgi:hypothetical protein
MKEGTKTCPLILYLSSAITTECLLAWHRIWGQRQNLKPLLGVLWREPKFPVKILQFSHYAKIITSPTMFDDYPDHGGTAPPRLIINVGIKTSLPCL